MEHNLQAAVALKLPASIALSTGATEAPPAMVAEIIDQLIEVLDLADGDTDLEAEGTEDSFDDLSCYGDGPGCMVADPDHCSAGDDVGSRYDTLCPTDGLPGDPDDAEHAWIERADQRNRHPRGKDGWILPEDAEEDDGPDSSGDEGEPDFRKPPWGHGAGCTISDSDFCLAGDDRIASGSCTGAMLLCDDTGPGDADDAEVETWTHAFDCDEEVHIGQRRPPRQLSPVHLIEARSTP